MGLIKQKGITKIVKTLQSVLTPYKKENSITLERIEDKIARSLYSAFKYDGIDINKTMINPSQILKKLGNTCRCKSQVFSDIYFESLGTYALAYKHYLQEDIEDESTLYNLLDEITKIVRTYTNLPVIIGIWSRDHLKPSLEDIYILSGINIIPYSEFEDNNQIKNELIKKLNNL